MDPVIMQFIGFISALKEGELNIMDESIHSETNNLIRHIRQQYTSSSNAESLIYLLTTALDEALMSRIDLRQRWQYKLYTPTLYADNAAGDHVHGRVAQSQDKIVQDTYKLLKLCGFKGNNSHHINESVIEETIYTRPAHNTSHTWRTKIQLRTLCILYLGTILTLAHLGNTWLNTLITTVHPTHVNVL